MVIKISYEPKEDQRGVYPLSKFLFCVQKIVSLRAFIYVLQNFGMDLEIFQDLVKSPDFLSFD